MSEEAIEEKEKTKRPLLPHFSRSDVMALLALLVSLGALFVSIYEARIMKEQQLLMQTQQKASVYPFLDQNWVYNFNPDKGSIIFTLANKGIGPAQINHIQFVLNDEPINDYSLLKEKLSTFFPDSANFVLSYASIDSYFLAAKEEIELFDLRFDPFPNAYQLISQLDMEFDVCYCSIYDDCWTIVGNADQPTPGNCQK